MGFEPGATTCKPNTLNHWTMLPQIKSSSDYCHLMGSVNHRHCLSAYTTVLLTFELWPFSFQKATVFCLAQKKTTWFVFKNVQSKWFSSTGKINKYLLNQEGGQKSLFLGLFGSNPARSSYSWNWPKHLWPLCTRIKYSCLQHLGKVRHQEMKGIQVKP